MHISDALPLVRKRVWEIELSPTTILTLLHIARHNIASANVAMNRLEDAVVWLERAADDGFPNFTYFSIDPNLDSLRRHPRFIEFMSRLETQWQGFKEVAAR